MRVLLSVGMRTKEAPAVISHLSTLFIVGNTHHLQHTEDKGIFDAVEHP